MYKVIFFDLDDTLFDQYNCSLKTLKILREKFNSLQKVTIHELNELYNALLNEVHNEYVLSGKADIAQARYIRFRRLYERIGVIEDHTDHDLAADMYREIYLQNRILVEGAAELLEELSKHFKLGIISNNQHKEQLDKLEHLNILKYFDKVITSELTGFKKPDKEIFDYALQEFNISKDDAILIGDSWETDIIGALNSGIKAIWLNRTGIDKPGDIDIIEIRSFIPKENIINFLKKTF